MSDRTIRVALAVVGLAALGWGGYLLVELMTASPRDGIQVAAWLVGGPVLHDAVIAPLVGVTGLAVSRLLPPPWRAPVAAGAAVTGVLVLLAVPLVWRPFGVATNPGLHDADYPAGLAVALGVVWLGVAVTGVLATRRAARSVRRQR